MTRIREEEEEARLREIGCTCHQEISDLIGSGSRILIIGQNLCYVTNKCCRLQFGGNT